MYTPWPDRNDKYALRSQLVDLIGDYIYFAPSHEVAEGGGVSFSPNDVLE